MPTQWLPDDEVLSLFPGGSRCHHLRITGGDAPDLAILILQTAKAYGGELIELHVRNDAGRSSHTVRLKGLSTKAALSLLDQLRASPLVETLELERIVHRQ